MMTENTIPYWMALAHAREFSTKRKMEFLIASVHEKFSIQEALDRVKSGDRLGFTFTEKEWNGLKASVNDLPNYAFLAERIEDQGIHTMHIWDKYVYPQSLKRNLSKEAPLLIYAKGNMDLLKKDSIAIVGARNSKPVSLDFTDNVAKKAVQNGDVIVSGFARGVDKKALDSALHYKGQSIIVLPQGIETYKSKAYYQEMVKGNVLVMSIYHPKAPWSVGLAMDRNKIIYGLANRIYAAESNNSGGTWEGVLNGLKRGRTVYVRKPETREKNANLNLIEKGAVPVDNFGNELSRVSTELFNEPEKEYEKEIEKKTEEKEFIDRLIDYLSENKEEGLTTSEIKEKFRPDEKISKKLTVLLNRISTIKKAKKGRENYYSINNDPPDQKTLF